MKLRKLTLALAAVGVASVGMIGCGGSSSNRSSTTTVSGLAIDGYLALAIVCVDTNRNKVCDPGEPQDITDENGNFSISTTDTTSPLVLQAVPNQTTDISTGLPVDSLFLTAPNGSANVTPLTTLAQVKSEVEGTSYADAQTSVISDLGLTGVTDLAGFDYIAAQSSSDSATAAAAVKAAATAQVVASVITNNMSTISSSSSSANTSGNANALAVYDLFDNDGTGTAVSQIATSVNSTVDAGGSVNTSALASANTISSTEVESDLTNVDTAISGPGTGGTGGSDT